MADIMVRFASIGAVWAVAGLTLWWGHLPAAWRRGLGVLASAAGLVSLILAVNSEGFRESPTMATFLLGTPHVTQLASASASLPYYVLTGVCLLLATLGLGLGDDLAPLLARRWLALAVALSLAVTALRFALEKVAAPAAWTYPVGIVWLGPVVGACFAWNLRRDGKGVRALLSALALYALAVRGAVAGLVVAASSLRLGSHYDVTSFVSVRVPWSGRIASFAPGSLEQLLWLGVLPQLLFWPLFTFVTGLLGASLVWLRPGAGAGEAVTPEPEPVPRA